MRRTNLGGVTLLSLALTVVSLYAAGWARTPAGTCRYARHACAAEARAADDGTSAAADRYRAQRTRHWRQLMYSPK